jgi:hypothetical protein
LLCQEQKCFYYAIGADIAVLKLPRLVLRAALVKKLMIDVRALLSGS